MDTYKSYFLCQITPKQLLRGQILILKHFSKLVFLVVFTLKIFIDFRNSTWVTSLCCTPLALALLRASLELSNHSSHFRQPLIFQSTWLGPLLLQRVAASITRTIGQPPWVPGTTCRAHVVIWEYEKIEFATGFYSAFGGALCMPITCHCHCHCHSWTHGLMVAKKYVMYIIE